MDRRVFKDNPYVVRIPLLQRMSSGAVAQVPAVGLNVSAFFSATKGGAAIGPNHGIVLVADPVLTNLYGGIITGVNITLDLFSGANNFDQQAVWLRLVDAATRLNLSLRRTAYAIRTA